MNEFTKQNFLEHSFNKHAFNLEYYKKHRKEKHDYNVWYYAHNKDKWKLQGGTNASGGSTNSRPTSTTEAKPTGSYGPNPRQKKTLEKIADGILKTIPAYNNLYTDAQDFARPFLKAVHKIKGWKTPGEGFSKKFSNVSVADIKRKLTEWENKYNAAEKKIKDFKYNVTSVFKNNDF